ncbi:beta-glucosidase [Paractinoplanes deccanensis]|uniref:beta-glucosidase n=1 Tax=Paractinoplanes deccanensis TaxID=113561 RepID=A0ABQ3Y4Z3_9ACTN|nr:glycoside hydrolase family 3 protein [Actinoplanes deccanensis]GID75053.1 beta-glucosidase [Actinoplanes deccanensis]
MTRLRWRPVAFLAAGVLAAGLVPGTATATAQSSAQAQAQAPYKNPQLPVDRRVADLLSRMTLADKVGQMTQAERGALAADPAQVATLRLGSVLSGGGSVPPGNTPAAWVEMINTFQRYALSTPLGIPILYGVDAVHGHGNVYGATVFPHNTGLGATRDARLVERVYRATAEEVTATGIPWNFAPCVCVSRDERWGRAYESFSEDPRLVTRLGAAAVDGTQRAGVMATAKHFAGDGDTEYGTGSGDFTIDQGITVTNRADFARINLGPYVSAIRHDVGSVMPSFSSVDWTEDGVGNPTKMHASRELLTGLLKGRLGFGGLVVSDWEGIHQIPDPSGAAAPTPLQVRVGVNAGTDLFMEPNTAPQFIQVLTAEIAAGRVSMARVDDAVRRILRAKFELGLFEHPYVTAGPIGTAAHRALAREAVAESQVLLKNSGDLLPLRPDSSLYVAGRNADDIGNQAGGWTIDWQGRSGDAIPGTTILEGIRSVAPRARVTYSADASAPIAATDIGVVVVGETPYAEGFGDVGAPPWPWGTEPQKEPKLLTLQPGDRAVVDKVCSAVAKCVVLLVSGRPQVITDQLGTIDALVASWLPGSEGAGVADVLFGREPFTGRLPVSWPATVGQVPINVGDKAYNPLYPYGWGLRTGARHGSSLDGLRDAAQARVVAGRAGAGWAASLAGAAAAEEAGNTAQAAALLRKVIRS